MSRQREVPFYERPKFIAGATLFAGAVATGAFLFSRYKVCNPNQILVRTGLGIKNMAVTKQSFLLPFQKYNYIDMTPFPLSFKLRTMSKEKVEFELPINMTIRPIDPEEDLEGFTKYAKYCLNQDTKTLNETIINLSQGECRVLTTEKTIEELFTGREEFKAKFTKKLVPDFRLLGLELMNTNIAEMHDSDGNEYFKFRRKRALEGAVNEAKVDVAEAQKKGDIGEADRKAETRKKKAEYEAGAVEVESQQKILEEKARTELEVKKAEFKRAQEVARIDADMKAKNFQMERQAELEQHRQKQQMESQRADQLTKATIEAESKIKEAEGIATSRIREAEGIAASQIKQAEAQSTAMRMIAEAERFKAQQAAEALLVTEQKKAEALLITKQKEAEGIRATFDAESKGYRQLFEAAGTNVNLVAHNWNLKYDLFPKMAEKQAMAVHRMKPKFVFYGQDSSAMTSTMHNMVKSFPPVLDGMSQITNIDFGKMIAQKLGAEPPKTKEPKKEPPAWLDQNP